MKRLRVAIIGGGAAGYFAAIQCASANAAADVHILEGTQRPLTKVRISGGGRCNVTHHCFDPEVLARNYPRGQRELRGPFSRFQPKDTVQWFESRGVALKAEADGRMFPVTDDSQTIIDCLQKAARDAMVNVRLGAIVKDVAIAGRGHGFVLTLRDGTEEFDHVLLATGSGPQGHAAAKKLGHVLVDPMPSLFTFNVQDSRLGDLAGVSFPETQLTLRPDGSDAAFTQKGPLLITHWGLSGPAVLKLSAFAARELGASRYQARLNVDFAREGDLPVLVARFQEAKRKDPRKTLGGEFSQPKRFMQKLFEHVGLGAKVTWANLSNDTLTKLARELADGEYRVNGKGVFKDEFVTAGGVSLKEVDFRTMQSKRCPGLYFAGEILDIDGVTGGFNFQSAWTTGYIAGRAMAETSTRALSD